MSNQTPSCVLLIEDSPDLAWTYQRFLAKAHIPVNHVATGAGALQHLERRRPAAVFLDLGLPDMPGLEVLRRVAAREPGTPVVVITANDNVETAVQAMKGGARDFLTKPFTAERMLTALHGVLASAPSAPQPADTAVETGDLLGTSAAIGRVRRTIARAAQSDAPVFLTGESGTGKDVCARAIHATSARRGGPFVPVNCASLARDLMPSELFGHARGAFTGAVSARAGAARRADGGTLFLDEICEMEPFVQAKLLRFAEDRRVTPLGSDRAVSVDVRLICATNKDPSAEVEAGRLRADLYYRLHVVPLHLPPLRVRGDDAVLLARTFLDRMEKGRRERKRLMLASDAEAFIRAHAWPGNVRQLYNTLRSAAVLSEDCVLSGEVLRAIASARRGGGEPEPARRLGALRDVERAHIEDAIARCGGSIARAARLLEVAPSTIYRKRAAWNAGRRP